MRPAKGSSVMKASMAVALLRSAGFSSDHFALEDLVSRAQSGQRRRAEASALPAACGASR